MVIVECDCDGAFSEFQRILVDFRVRFAVMLSVNLKLRFVVGLVNEV